ncbi:hypothetical protein [Streptosporangium lutulentum]|uniref:Uncharacterized protein n=1 Tax=Streptosporangium lutulentum TaxID=1461250 RepID=A0ABT9QNW1_9ACTN|nr:hypothetical protein [Streptosporangium lutulentum]MDP9847699.1 hypothetical protein [Streptosporangium lutulentum]
MTLVAWQAGPDLLACILRRHGQAPDAITDTMAAWAAFAEFAQTKVTGIDTRPDSDSDGFILQWGRRSWNDHRPSMSFARQVAVPCADGQFDGCGELRQIELVLLYEDSGVTSSHPDQDTGFFFPNGDEEWQAALGEAQDFPPFQAVAAAAPVSSSLT